eukprot:354869-Chlamydomonas_euryale.AAC.5
MVLREAKEGRGGDGGTSLMDSGARSRGRWAEGSTPHQTLRIQTAHTPRPAAPCAPQASRLGERRDFAAARSRTACGRVELRGLRRRASQTEKNDTPQGRTREMSVESVNLPPKVAVKWDKRGHERGQYPGCRVRVRVTGSGPTKDMPVLIAARQRGSSSRLSAVTKGTPMPIPRASCVPHRYSPVWQGRTARDSPVSKTFSGPCAFLSFLHSAVVEVGYERADPV